MDPIAIFFLVPFAAICAGLIAEMVMDDE